MTDLTPDPKPSEPTVLVITDGLMRYAERFEAAVTQTLEYNLPPHEEPCGDPPCMRCRVLQRVRLSFASVRPPEPSKSYVLPASYDPKETKP